MTVDVEAERERLQAELTQLGFYHGMPDASFQARRNARIAELQAQLAALPRQSDPPRPPPGRRVNFYMAKDGRLGNDPRAFERDDAGEHLSGLDYNPYARSPTARRDD